MPLPLSGKSGYLLTQGTEEPLYEWRRSSVGKSPSYSNSEVLNLVRYSQGPQETNYTLAGVRYKPAFLVDYYADPKPRYIEVGYIDFAASLRNSQQAQVLIRDFELTFNYSSSNDLSFSWMANCIAVNTDIVVFTRPNTGSDFTVCIVPPLCSLPIQTTDTANPITSVVRAVYRVSYDVVANYLSDALIMPKGSTGIQTEELLITVQADFNYWLGLFDSGAKFYYRLFYGSGPADFWAVDNMFVQNITDLVCNVRTGEIMSLTAELAHG